MDDLGMQSIAKSYFTNLFKKQHNISAPVIDVICTFVTGEDNISLTKPFTKEEFKVAMFSMHSDKCPWTDGFNPGFYQHFWDSCSDNIFSECCHWLDTSQLPADLNMKKISLILKGTTQTSMKD